MGFFFRFRDLGPLRDGELELVAPAARHIEAMAQSDAETPPEITRLRCLDLLADAPLGHEPGGWLGGLDGRVPTYHFWMRLGPAAGYDPPVPMGGMIGLRVGDTAELRLYGGHVGYHVFPAARGRGLAGRATRLLLPLAAAHGLREVWITANPENLASRRTIEKLGGVHVDTIDLPRRHVLYRRGERRKARYRIEL